MKLLKTLLTCLLVCLSSYLLAGKKDTVHTIPIIKIDNLILLEAEAQGKKGYFMLDTGIPNVWLNDQYFEGTPSFPPEYAITGLYGEKQEVRQLPVVFQVLKIKKALNAYVVDLEYIEKAKSISLLGMIGRSFFKNYELVIDLSAMHIQLIPLDNRGNPLFFEEEIYKNEVPFHLNGHVPVIPVQILGFDMLLGLDTGAEFNIIDTSFIAPIFNHIGWKPNSNKNDDESRHRLYRIPGLEIGYWDCEAFLTIFSSMRPLSNSMPGVELDGILGGAFLTQQKVSINYKKKRLYLWLPSNSKEILIARKTGSKKKN